MFMRAALISAIQDADETRGLCSTYNIIELKFPAKSKLSGCNVRILNSKWSCLIGANCPRRTSRTVLKLEALSRVLHGTCFLA